MVKYLQPRASKTARGQELHFGIFAHSRVCILLYATPEQAIDKRAIMSYTVAMLNLIKNKYYKYTPGEFLPIYEGNDLINKRDFHMYKIKWIMRNRQRALYQFTHYAN